MTSLNPVFTIGNQLKEAIELHTDRKGKVAMDRAIEMLTLVGVNEPEKRVNSILMSCPAVCASVL